MSTSNLQDFAATPQFQTETCISLDNFTNDILFFLDQRNGPLTVDEVCQRIQQGGR